MKLLSLHEVASHGVAFYDFNVIYQTELPIQLQLYSYGLVRLFNDFEVGCAREYKTGLVHVRIHAWRSALDLPFYRALEADFQAIREVRNDMQAGLRQAIRANLHFEVVPNRPRFQNLVEAISHMMKYAFFDTEILLADKLRERLGDAAMYELSHPVVTPYLVVLQQEGQRYWSDARPDLERFIKRAAFLRDPDIVLDRWWTDQGEVERFLENSKDFSDNARFDNYQRRARREATLLRLQPLDSETRSLLELYLALVDYEEARHYWQGRTLKNIAEYAAGVGKDPLTTTLEALLDA